MKLSFITLLRTSLARHLSKRAEHEIRETVEKSYELYLQFVCFPVNRLKIQGCHEWQPWKSLTKGTVSYLVNLKSPDWLI